MKHFLQYCTVIAALAMATGFPARAESPRTAGNNPLGGMGQSSDQPVQIEAATLEVRDKNKTATFSGNVQVVQGDTTMKCQNLIVFYGQEIGVGENASATATASVKTGGGMPQNAQSIRRIEATGGVTVLTKDQNVVGERAVYDLKTKTITLSGNVTVSQGQNVIHGERVVVDTASGNARVESGSTAAAGSTGGPGSRVRALIQPGKGQGGGPTNFMTIGPGKTN
jgi:lipopolysaccharide export system protein LptA